LHQDFHFFTRKFSQRIFDYEHQGNEAIVIHDTIFSLQKSISHGSSDLMNCLNCAFVSPLLILCLLAILKSKELMLDLKPVFNPLLVWFGILGLFFFLYFPFYYGTGNPDYTFFPARTSNGICIYLCFALPAGLFKLEWLSKVKNQVLTTPSSPIFFHYV
jgi:hypothetical protein